MNEKSINDPRRLMRHLQWDNYYDPATRILHANWDEGFFSNTTTALWALADLALEGICPKKICCSNGWDKYCDRKTQAGLDLYPIFFKPDIYQNYELWIPLPRFVHGRHVLAKTNRWEPLVKRWFNPSERVLGMVADFKKKYQFDPENTIGVFYRGTDKRFEIPISNFSKYQRVLKFLLEKRPEGRIFIQTDQEEFRDYLTAKFGDRCFFLQEMPVAKGSTGLHFLSDDELQLDRVEYGMRVLAATYMISQCHSLINATGNMALWITFYRGHTNEMYQFDENALCSDPLGRNFSDNFFVRGYRGLKARSQRWLGVGGTQKKKPSAEEMEPNIFFPRDGRLPRAHAQDNFGRFREVISDPLNLLIERVPEAGYMQDGIVTLHNGVKVPFSGAQAYYEGFSSIFIFNRGVHEPLEEFVFQRLLAKLPEDSLMIELGAYWGHYSMWFKKMKPAGQVVLVEPDANNLEVGRSNFLNNGLDGEFIQSFVGQGHFGIDEFLEKQKISRLHLLHSDIQGYELEMLDGAKAALESGLVDYIFISTHTQNLHEEVLARLEGHGYRIEVAAGYDEETTSFDGLVFASNKRLEPLLSGFKPMGRLEILKSTPMQRADYLAAVARQVC